MLTGVPIKKSMKSVKEQVKRFINSFFKKNKADVTK